MSAEKTVGTSGIKDLFKTKSSMNSTTDSYPHSISAHSTQAKRAGQTYREWGVQWSGIASGNIAALNPALQSCYTTNVNEQKANQVQQDELRNRIQGDIAKLEGLRKAEEIKLDSEQKQKKSFEEKVIECKDKIDDIKRGDDKNLMAKVNFWIGAVIVILLAGYLFVFYSSACFSAFFGNHDITQAGEAIFNPKCYALASENGFGQFIFILLMPVIFLALGFLIHQFTEQSNGIGKYFKILCLYVVTFIFDALLAFEISKKVYDYTVLSDADYTVSMAINSPDFWIVIFSGFIAYVIWGLVFDFTLDHFDRMSVNNKEIQCLENKIAQLNINIQQVEAIIADIRLKINTKNTEIQQLKTRLQDSDIISISNLKKALSDFFTGWLGYMNVAALPQTNLEQATKVYEAFLNNLQTK